MTKYPFHTLNKNNKQEYLRLRWQEYKKTHSRTVYFKKRYAEQKNPPGISFQNRKAAQPFKKNKCEICGSVEKLVTHHINHNQDDNCLKNIQTLCTPCHVRVHKRKILCVSVQGEFT